MKFIFIIDSAYQIQVQNYSLNYQQVTKEICVLLRLSDNTDFLLSLQRQNVLC